MSLFPWIQALIEWVAPPEHRDELVGDLVETHERRVAERGRAVASLMTALEALDLTRALLVERVTGRARRTRTLHEAATTPRFAFSWIDVKLGVRIMRRYPALTLVGVLPMAAAVAAAVGAFVVSDMMLHPRLPLPEGDRVVAIQVMNTTTQVPEMRVMTSFLSWREELETVEDVSAYSTYQAHVGREESAEAPVRGSRITASGFGVARVPPFLGRTLLDKDERPGAADVVVLGHDLWRDRLGSDPDVVGTTVFVDAAPHTVVGVMPEGFRFPFSDQIWVPLRAEAPSGGASDGPPIQVFGRLRDGATLRDAQAELNVLGRRAPADDPESFASLRPRVSRYAEAFWSGPGLVFYGVQFVLVLLLVVVCATVGSLVFVRNLSRESEITMRFLLGATRERIVAQLFVESLVTSVLAAGLAYLVVAGGLPWAFQRLLSTTAPGTVPFWIRPESGGGAMVYVVALAGLSAVVSGILPALTLTTTRRGAPLTRVASGTARLGRRGAVVVAAQTTLTVGILTLASGLLPYVTTSGGPAFAADAGRYVTASATGSSHPIDLDHLHSLIERLHAGMAELVERLEAQPDVESATLASELPGEPPHDNRLIQVEGAEGQEDDPTAQVVWVWRDYFQVMRIPLRVGRFFRASDFGRGEEVASVAIVTESFARRWFGDGNPLGRRVRLGRPRTYYPGDTEVPPSAEIVGVVGDVGMEHGRPTRPDGVYFPMLRGRYLTYVIALAHEEPGTLGARMSREVATIDPWIRMARPRTLESVIASRRGFRGTVFAVLALATLTALLLSLSALYAIVSFFARQRSRSIAIRIALGGHPAGAAVRVLASALKPLGIGIAAGVALLWVARLVTLVSVSWTALLLVSATTVGVGLLACAIPALRATNMSLVEVIRDEG